MKTKVTLEQLRHYLEQFGWHKYQVVDEPYEQEGLLRTGWHLPNTDEGYRMIIDPIVEKACLSFRVPAILLKKPEEWTQETLYDLLRAISWINYALLLGKFAYDPSKGEVRFSIDVPIDNSTFTYEQFIHCLHTAVYTVELYAPLLQGIAGGQIRFEDFYEMVSATARPTIPPAIQQLLDELERLLQEEERV